jgi:gliding motility-associated-like protein
VSDEATLENQYETDPDEREDGTVITLQLRSTDNCDGVPPEEVTFRLQPIQAANAGADRDACEQGFELNGQVLAANGTGKWTGGQGTFVNGRSSLTGMYIPSPGEVAAHSVTLTLTADNPNLCDNPSDDVTITLLPPPTVQADASPVRYVAKGKTITLNPIVSDENVTYSWLPTTGLSDAHIKNPVVTGIADITYTLTITDALFCSTTSSEVLVRISPQLTPKNTFTPNADGINDTWVIEGIEAYPKMVVDIYNRLGQPVYHSVGYAQPWDGTSNGKPVPFGVYYFVIDTKELEQKVTGYVTIIR